MNKTSITDEIRSRLRLAPKLTPNDLRELGVSPCNDNPKKITTTPDYIINCMRAIFILRLRTCSYEFINIHNTKSYVGRTHITQLIWQEIMGYNPSVYIGDNLPVDSVSYTEIQDFIKRLSSDIDTGDAFDISFELLSESIWEQVAGTINDIFVDTKHIFTAGLKSGFSPARVWSAENSNGHPHEIALFSPNEFGLYDMYGNVWDMCLGDNSNYPRQEGESDIAYKRRLLKIALLNGKSIGLRNISLRGGAWNITKEGCKYESKMAASVNDKYLNAGFRLTATITSPIRKGLLYK